MDFLWYSHLLESQGVHNSCKITIDPVSGVNIEAIFQRIFATSMSLPASLLMAWSLFHELPHVA